MPRWQCRSCVGAKRHRPSRPATEPSGDPGEFEFGSVLAPHPPRFGPTMVTTWALLVRLNQSDRLDNRADDDDLRAARILLDPHPEFNADMADERVEFPCPAALAEDRTLARINKPRVFWILVRAGDYPHPPGSRRHLLR